MLEVGNRLRKTRKKRGLSQIALSELSGIPQSTLSEIETGVKLPGIFIALVLAEKLDCRVEHIFYLRRANSHANV